MKSIDSFIWEAVVHGPYVPMHVVKDEEVAKLRSKWNESEKKKAQYDLVAKNRKEGILNLMNQIPLTTLALAVVKQGTSKWIVQTINQRTNLPARKLKGARGEDLTFLGKRMKYLQPVALQPRVRKPICASW